MIVVIEDKCYFCLDRNRPDMKCTEYLKRIVGECHRDRTLTRITFIPGVTKRIIENDDDPSPDDLNEDLPPQLCFSGKRTSAYIVLDKESYKNNTDELFTFLAVEGKLVCPRCKTDISFDGERPDYQVGLEGWRLIYCENDECYYGSEKMNDEREKELKEELFPTYWRWKEEEKPCGKTTS